jgi:DNA-binding SARP family transcriptional activator
MPHEVRTDSLEASASARHDSPRLSLTLLGPWSAALRPGSALVLPGRKAQALLAYLALSPGAPQPRGRLMTLLWGEQEERLAGQSLRRALYLIRRALGVAEDLLISAGDTVGLEAGVVDVDVREFERLAGLDDADGLEQALALYRGELLEGLDVGSAGFEDWLRGQRERLYEIAVQVAGQLLARQTRAGRLEPAVQTAVRLLALEPAEEPVHRALMRLYARLGRRAAALRQYQLCVEVLRREHRVEPEAETTELYLEILPGHAPPGLAERRAATVGPAAEAPLMGRAAEMAALLQALDDAGGGAGRLVVIAGDAGIGKTRLLAELPQAARQRGGRLLSGHCYQTEQVLPFRPFIEALRQGGLAGEGDAVADLAAPVRAELARLFPELGAAPTTAATTAEARAWLFEAVADLLGRLADRQPLVLTVEDIHWADEMTLYLLAFLARRIAARRLLIVATVREEDVEDAPGLGLVLAELSREGLARRILLSALSEVETAELVSALGHARPGEDRTAQRAARVWQASRGNPLVVVETMRELLEHPAVETDEDPPIPSRVRELIATRLGRLGEPTRQIMAVAAVAAEPSSFELLAGAGGMSERETAEAVERLVRRRVLQSAGELLEFSHERVRQVALELLLPARRRALHRAVGETLETLHAGGTGELDDRLAHHFVQARMPDKAVTYLTRFAETARRRHALDEAARSLDQAAALADQLPGPDGERRRIDLLLRKAFVLAIRTRYQEVFDLLAPHEARVGDLRDPAIAGPYYFRRGIACLHLRETDRANDLARRALEEGTRCGDRETMGRAHYVQSLRLHWLGHGFEDGVAHARRAVVLLEQAADAHYHGWAYYTLAHHLYYLGAFGPALDAAAQPEAIADRFHEPRLASLGCLMGLICATRGDSEAGVRHCQHAVARSNDPVVAAASRACLGHAYALGGDAPHAIAELTAAIEGLHAAGAASGEARFLGCLADAYLLDGAVTLAHDTAMRALALSEALGHPWSRAWAERSLGRAALASGDRGGGERHLRTALEQFDALKGRFEAARTGVDLAGLLHGGGRRVEARDALDAARTAFTALEVPIWEARAVDLGRRLGLGG